jgi:hypothetical protein
MGITNRWFKKGLDVMRGDDVNAEIHTHLNNEYHGTDKFLGIFNLRSALNVMGVLIVVDLITGCRLAL